MNMLFPQGAAGVWNVLRMSDWKPGAFVLRVQMSTPYKTSIPGCICVVWVFFFSLRPLFHMAVCFLDVIPCFLHVVHSV